MWLCIRTPNILIPVRSDRGSDGPSMSVTPRPAGAGSLGQHGSPARIWEAVVRLLTAVVSYVRVEDDMFDEILDILSDVMEQSSEARAALETINADAVWLVRYEKGLVSKRPAPVVEGLIFVEM